MITFVPHVLYDRASLLPGARMPAASFFAQSHDGKDPDYRIMWTNMPVGSVGSLPWPFVVTGFSLMGDGIDVTRNSSPTPSSHAEHVLVRLRIGEMLRWTWPLVSLRRSNNHAQDRWEHHIVGDWLGWGPAAPLQKDFKDWDRAREAVGELVTQYPWAIPAKQNFSLDIITHMAFSGTCQNMRAELHGLRAMEWG